MSMDSDPSAAPSDDERRLHPLSWLFVLLQQFRSFAIPLVVLLMTGRGSRGEWLGLVGVVGLTIVAAAQYFTFRYRTGPDGVVIRSGLFQRTNRDIPYERIHTVNLHQSLLHRLFAVTEVRLESAGGKDAEATMRVLSQADARALETLIRERGQTRRSAIGADDAATAAMPAEVPLLTLTTAEIVRLGLISNRGLVVVAAAFGAIWQAAGGQFSADDLPAWFTSTAAGAGRYVSDHIHDVALLAIAAAALLVVLVGAVRALSVLLALLQYHGFRLTEVGRQLRVERGLLTRVRNQLPRRRIQAWRVDETLLHRWFGRRSVRVDSAAGNEGDDHGVRHLVPIGLPDDIDRLIGQLTSADAWPVTTWRGVHPRAWRRMFVMPSTFVAAVSLVGSVFAGPVALLGLALVPCFMFRARRMAAFEGYACSDRVVAVRSGWLSRTWGLIDVRKVQAVQLTESPLDRRHGMATVWLDSAGASATEGVLRVRHLPVEDARALYAHVTARMDARL